MQNIPVNNWARPDSDPKYFPRKRIWNFLISYFVKKIRHVFLDNNEFYNQFENEIKRGNFNLETIKKIINLYHDQIEQNNIILINSVLFENESLETALLKTITNANSKLFYKIYNLTL